MELSDMQHQTAGLIVELIASRLGAERGVHPETAIAVAARLAGSMLFRSFPHGRKASEPGSMILSHEANEKGPELISILGSMLSNFEIVLDEKKLGGEPEKRGNESTLSFLETMDLFQGDVITIIQGNNLGYEDGAQAIAMATAFIVKECSRNIEAEVGFNIAVFGFIEGCKTVPPFWTGESKI